MSLLDRSPGRRVHFSRAGWLRWRAVARLHLLLYAAGWTVQRWRLRLRAPLRHEYWRLWGLVTRSRRVCPANAHGALIWHTRPLREIFVDRTCRQDCADNGACWCGNLRAALPRRPGHTRPATPSAGPEGPATPLAGQGTVPVVPAPGAVPVIRAGGRLLPDRDRDRPEPMPFRIPPYYLAFMAEQAAGRWLA